MPALILYKDIASAWVCVTVYVWILEVQKLVVWDSEPLSDWLADCAAILLTLVFWTLLFSMPIAVVAPLVGRSRLLSLNKLAVKACLMLVTALYFVRWLSNWQAYFVGYDFVLIVLIIATIGFAIWTFKRRKTGNIILDANLPSFEEGSRIAALTVLFCAVALIGIRGARDLVLGQNDATAVASEPKPPYRPNIILIVSDAARAQSMSLYGHTRATTPNLTNWAKAATVFLHAHTNSTSTRVSMTTILTGKLPWSHGRLTRDQPPFGSDQNLLRLLRDHGYFVGAVTSNEDASVNLLGFGSSLSERETAAFEFLTLSWLRRLGVSPTLNGGRMYRMFTRFLWFLGYPDRTSYYGYADYTLKAAKSFIGRARQPFFLLVHLQEPHDPYDPPLPFKGMYYTKSAANQGKEISANHYGPYEAALQPAVDFYRDQYEETIQYLDEQIGVFFRYVEKQLPTGDYLVIFTSDHGESFERGYMNHGEELFESSTRVPLVIRFPKQRQETRLPGLVQSVDLAPTMLSVAGIEIPRWMDGRALSQDKAPPTESTVAVNYKQPVGQTTYDFPTKLAIWSKSHKLIVSCDTGAVSLYNLAVDSSENIDLSRTAPAMVKDLKSSLESMLLRRSKRTSFSCAITE